MKEDNAENMASASLAEDLTCSICLSVFTDPVILLCGHSFCRDCISVSLSKQPHCPNCRTPVSTEGPYLLTNHILKSLAEKTKEATKQKLEYRLDKEKSEWLCLEHDEKLKLYCITDQLLTCVICRDGQRHEAHTFKPVGEAATLVRKELENFVEKVSTDTKALESLVQSQQEEMTKTNKRSQELKTLIKNEFKKMYTFLKKREGEMINKVTCDKKDGMKKMTESLDALKEAISENKTLEETVTSTLQIEEVERFLKTWSEEKEVKAAKIFFRPKGENFQVEKTHLSLGPYESHLQIFVWKEMLQVIQPREEKLSLKDDQTSLIVSQDTHSLLVCHLQQQQQQQSYQDPYYGGYRNTQSYQKLPDSTQSTNTFAGQHYWEIDVAQVNDWELGLPQSYLKLLNSQYQMCSECHTTALKVEGTPQKIGIYLNCPSKELSFYNADNMAHIHTVSVASTVFPVSAHFKMGNTNPSHTPLTVCWY